MAQNKFWVFDGHNDTMLALPHQRRSFHVRSEKGHIDLPRMREGNFQAGLFAVWPCFTSRMMKKWIKNWFSIVDKEKNELMQIKKFEDFAIAENLGKIGAVLHFESVGGFDKELTSLDHYYKMGLRSFSLTWFETNKFGTGARMLGKEKKRGLTDLGRILIIKAQSLGINIDVSHLNIPSFWDVLEVAKKPITATHSDAFAIATHRRNLNDAQIKAIHETHGTIGINFGTLFLNPEKPGKTNRELGFEVVKQHIDHIVSVADINTVSMGSDFDGAIVPKCLKDCAQFPKLFEYLLENGYSEQDIKKISHENWIRVLKTTWAQ
ncbi:MAG: dipeptidase [Promethearchaeota archaeon]